MVLMLIFIFIMLSAKTAEKKILRLQNFKRITQQNKSFISERPIEFCFCFCSNKSCNNPELQLVSSDTSYCSLFKNKLLFFVKIGNNFDRSVFKILSDLSFHAKSGSTNKRQMDSKDILSCHTFSDYFHFFSLRNALKILDF